MAGQFSPLARGRSARHLHANLRCWQLQACKPLPRGKLPCDSSHASCLRKVPSWRRDHIYIARYAQWICLNARIALAYLENSRRKLSLSPFEDGRMVSSTLYFSPRSLSQCSYRHFIFSNHSFTRKCFPMRIDSRSNGF